MHPFYYSKRSNLIRPNICDDVPFTAQFLLGARYTTSRSNYLFYNPTAGNLLVGHENTVDVNTINSAIIASAKINLTNCKNTVVAGWDSTIIPVGGARGVEEIKPTVEYTAEGILVNNFTNTLIADKIVTNSKVRIGSLTDQGSSVIVTPYCLPNCVPYNVRPVGWNCQCGEKDDFAKVCTQSEIFLDPWLTVYGDGHIKGDLAVDSAILADNLSVNNSVIATTGSFGRSVAGSTLSSYLQVPLDAPQFDITTNTFATYILVASVQFPQEIRLTSQFLGFIPSQTYSFKDTTLEYGDGANSNNFIITCDFTMFMEVHDSTTGRLVRKAGGGYVVDTVGGSVSFLLVQSLSNELTWVITQETRGTPRN